MEPKDYGRIIGTLMLVSLLLLFTSCTLTIETRARHAMFSAGHHPQGVICFEDTCYANAQGNTYRVICPGKKRCEVR